MSSFYDYNSFWNYLNDFLNERFNCFYTYKFYLEPFLEGCFETDYSTVGIFSDEGLFIFFKLDEKLPGRFREEEFLHSKLTVTVNPNFYIKEKELEFLLIKYSQLLRKKKQQLRENKT